MYALIIAGGQGERLRPLTNDRPKPMVEVKGKPILAHQVDWLKQGGVTDVVMLCGYRGDVVADYFGEGEAFGVAISYSFEDEPLGRGGALRQGYEQVPRTEDTIVALNGDILTHQPLAEIIERHRATGAVGTIMLTHPTSSFGIVNVEDDDRITAFAEKPVLPYWINAGIYVLGPEFFQRLPEKGDHEDVNVSGPRGRAQALRLQDHCLLASHRQRERAD